MSTVAQSIPKFLTAKALAERWGIQVQTLAVWRCNRRANLPFTKIGTRVLYAIADVEKYEAANRVLAATPN